jgi:hypothetical protein
VRVFTKGGIPVSAATLVDLKVVRAALRRSWAILVRRSSEAPQGTTRSRASEGTRL